MAVVEWTKRRMRLFMWTSPVLHSEVNNRHRTGLGLCPFSPLINVFFFLFYLGPCTLQLLMWFVCSVAELKRCTIPATAPVTAAGEAGTCSRTRPSLSRKYSWSLSVSPFPGSPSPRVLGNITPKNVFSVVDSCCAFMKMLDLLKHWARTPRPSESGCR